MGETRRGLTGWSAATVLVSAFLLFQVQPMVSKMILPWFGGGPSVWTTCMLFFQVFLLAGYAYAHALERLPRTRVGGCDSPGAVGGVRWPCCRSCLPTRGSRPTAASRSGAS